LLQSKWLTLNGKYSNIDILLLQQIIFSIPDGKLSIFFIWLKEQFKYINREGKLSICVKLLLLQSK
jgi:hypothetical protein